MTTKQKHTPGPMAIETPGLDELRELNGRLCGLLAEPRPGLMTWRETLSRTLLEMADFAGWGRVSAFPDILEACKATRTTASSIVNNLERNYRPTPSNHAFVRRATLDLLTTRIEELEVAIAKAEEVTR